MFRKNCKRYGKKCLPNMLSKYSAAQLNSYIIIHDCPRSLRTASIIFSDIRATYKMTEDLKCDSCPSLFSHPFFEDKEPILWYKLACLGSSYVISTQQLLPHSITKEELRLSAAQQTALPLLSSPLHPQLSPPFYIYPAETYCASLFPPVHYHPSIAHTFQPLSSRIALPARAF